MLWADSPPLTCLLYSPLLSSPLNLKAKHLPLRLHSPVCPRNCREHTLPPVCCLSSLPVQALGVSLDHLVTRFCPSFPTFAQGLSVDMCPTNSDDVPNSMYKSIGLTVQDMKHSHSTSGLSKSCPTVDRVQVPHGVLPLPVKFLAKQQWHSSCLSCDAILLVVCPVLLEEIFLHLLLPAPSSSPSLPLILSLSLSPRLLALSASVPASLSLSPLSLSLSLSLSLTHTHTHTASLLICLPVSLHSPLSPSPPYLAFLWALRPAKGEAVSARGSRSLPEEVCQRGGA
jgi:hypothetical protein